MQDIVFSKYHPFRRPDWRYERVLQMVDRFPSPGRSTSRDDIWVKGLRNFILQYRSGKPGARARLEYANPGLYFAWIIHEQAEEDYETAFMIESRILADQPDEEIAKEAHTLPEAIAWYEALFFNVRDRLESHDWVLKHVLMPSVLRCRDQFKKEQGAGDEGTGNKFIRDPLAEPFWDSSLKFMGYFGGKFIIDFMLTGYARGVKAQARDQTWKWVSNYFQGQGSRRAAMGIGHFEVNKYNVMELFQVHMRLVELQHQASKEGGAETTFEKNVEAFMSDIPWSVGMDGAKAVEGTPMAALDEGAAEMRDDELLLLSAGENIARIDEIATLTLPAPVKATKPGQEDQNANPQQNA
jgi:hypothetical protein